VHSCLVPSFFQQGKLKTLKKKKEEEEERSKTT
jgi:hypothetical protein